MQKIFPGGGLQQEQQKWREGGKEIGRYTSFWWNRVKYQYLTLIGSEYAIYWYVQTLRKWGLMLSIFYVVC